MTVDTRGETPTGIGGHPQQGGPMERCRCGWDGTGEHPCHCCKDQPGTMRLYDPRLVPLAGMQMKFEMRDTNACDGCWTWFQAYMADARRVELERTQHTGSTRQPDPKGRTD